MTYKFLINFIQRNKVCSTRSLRSFVLYGIEQERAELLVPVIRDGNLPNVKPEVCVEPVGRELNTLTNAGRFPRALRALGMTSGIALCYFL